MVELTAFRFLRVPGCTKFKVFKKNFFGDDDPEKLARLQRFIGSILLRRTHADQLFGRPLVTLPEASQKIHWVRFNDLERNVYEVVRERMIYRINNYSKEDNLEKKYANMLVMLLRLRQMTGHIISIQEVMSDLLEFEDHERLKELADEAADPRAVPEQRAQIVQLRCALKEHDERIRKQKERERDGGTPDPHEGPSNAGTTPSQRADSVALSSNDNIRAVDRFGVGGSHGLTYSFHAYLAGLRQGEKWEELKRRQECALCGQPPAEPWITSCYHIMCYECLDTLQTSAAEKDIPHARCPECADMFYESKRLEEWTLEVDNEPIGNDFYSHSDQKKRRKSKKNSDTDLAPNWLEMPIEQLLPSSKTVAIKSQILNWLEDFPHSKVIIFSQFHAMIKIISRMCILERWGYEQYHGQMSMADREKALESFAGDAEKRVLVASLKAGGVGLNLTMGNKVIIVDPWWNFAVEEQAFARIFRIGQRYETSMTRFVVEKTVDEEMMKMQRRKKTEIDEVIEDGAGGRKK